MKLLFDQSPRLKSFCFSARPPPPPPSAVPLPRKLGRIDAAAGRDLGSSPAERGGGPPKAVEGASPLRQARGQIRLSIGAGKTNSRAIPTTSAVAAKNSIPTLPVSPTIPLPLFEGKRRWTGMRQSSETGER